MRRFLGASRPPRSAPLLFSAFPVARSGSGSFLLACSGVPLVLPARPGRFGRYLSPLKFLLSKLGFSLTRPLSRRSQRGPLRFAGRFSLTASAALGWDFGT